MISQEAPQPELEASLPLIEQTAVVEEIKAQERPLAVKTRDVI
jgi:hypothetical protein